MSDFSQMRLPKNLTDVQILKQLSETWKNGRNPDSMFTAAACLIVKNKGGHKYIMFGVNTEFGLEHNSNSCAEANALSALRTIGSDFTIEKVYIMGAKKDAEVDLKSPLFTPPCPHCLAKISQFSDKSTQIIQVPFFNGASLITVAKEKSSHGHISNFIPPLLQYHTEESFDFLRACKKPDGLFSADKDNLLRLIADNSNKMFGEGYFRNPLEEFVRIGDSTTELEGVLARASGRNRAIQQYLQLARNIHFAAAGDDITRVEASVVVFEVNNSLKYYTAVSHAVGTGRKESSYLQTISQIRTLYPKAKVKQIFIMGDALSKNRDRFYPPYGDLYTINKVASLSLLDSGKQKPDCEIVIFPPHSKKLEPDTRDAKKFLSSSPAENAVLVTSLQAMQPASAFISPRYREVR